MPTPRLKPASPLTVPHRDQALPAWRGDTALLVYLAAATVLVHLVTGTRYGFQRDELATLDDARHLAWGYVAYPPVTPFFGRISLILFGTSLTGFRFFAALAEAVAVVVTGLMARALGAQRWAQLVAAAAAVPFCLGAGALMQYVSFDYLAWVLTAYFVMRLLQSNDPRWWLAVGAAIGFGLMSKYSMVFFALSLVLALGLTSARRLLANKWFVAAVAVALLIFLPNIIWQFQNHLVTLDFLRHIHARDVAEGRTQSFLPDQLRLTLLAAPLWMMGLYFYFFTEAGKRYRALGWLYFVMLVFFIVAKGRGYYLAAAYPMLYAAGATWLEPKLASLRRGRRGAVKSIVGVALLANITLITMLFLPLATPGSKWWKVENKVNGDLREEIGWPELVQTVARVRDSLAPQQRAHLAILGTNYGEAGAIDLYGPQYGLPAAISGVNSFWQRGYGDPEPQTVIVIGLDRDVVTSRFSNCYVAAHTWNQYGIANEETTEHPDIFVCGPPRVGWPEFWKHFRYFG